MIEVLSKSIQPSYNNFKSTIFAPIDPIFESSNLMIKDTLNLARNQLLIQFYVFEKEAYDKLKPD